MEGKRRVAEEIFAGFALRLNKGRKTEKQYLFDAASGLAPLRKPPQPPLIITNLFSSPRMKSPSPGLARAWEVLQRLGMDGLRGHVLPSNAVSERRFRVGKDMLKTAQSTYGSSKMGSLLELCRAQSIVLRASFSVRPVASLPQPIRSLTNTLVKVQYYNGKISS
jgi:hypothetical protein